MAPFIAPTYASARQKSVSSVTMPLGFMPPCYRLAPGSNRGRENKGAARWGGSFFSLYDLVIRHRRRGCGLLLLRNVGDERLGGQQHGGNTGRVLQRGTG